MPIYRKKPVEIKAMQFTGTFQNYKALTDWIIFDIDDDRTDSRITALYIRTLEGTMIATPGDYIIRGIQGEYYPCKPDIFRATYEAVE